MKRIVIILFLALFFTACANKEDLVIMDQPAEDGQYHYSNEDLGFVLTLPAEFEYYQTQRFNKDDYVDVEFFVPTADPGYPQEIQSYAKAVQFESTTRKHGKK